MTVQLDKESMRIYRELEQTQRTYSVVNQNLEILMSYLEESQQVIRTLEEIKTRKDNEKVMISLGKKVLVPARLIDSSKVLCSIGSDIKRDMTIDDAIEHVENDIDRTENVVEQTRKHKQQLEQSLNQLQQQLQRQQQQQQQAGGSNLRPVIDEDNT